jgi:hypothetical protein
MSHEPFRADDLVRASGAILLIAIGAGGLLVLLGVLALAVSRLF